MYSHLKFRERRQGCSIAPSLTRGVRNENLTTISAESEVSFRRLESVRLYLPEVQLFLVDARVVAGPLKLEAAASGEDCEKQSRQLVSGDS